MLLNRKDFSLYYEVRGEGDPLLLIHGVIVDGGLFEESAKLLAQKYKVILFDRRGNSRSVFYEKKERQFSMDEQADDIEALLEELGVQKAFVFGASAGAAIGQFFVQKYPERVRHLIMYEPACLRLIIDREPDLQTWVEKIEGMIAKKRFNRALLEFSGSIGAPDPAGRTKSAEVSMREYGNIEYAMTVELPGTLHYLPDLESMRSMREKITLAMGTLNSETVYHRIAPELSRQTGVPLVTYPGTHNFPFEQPELFADGVSRTLEDFVKRNTGC